MVEMYRALPVYQRSGVADASGAVFRDSRVFELQKQSASCIRRHHRERQVARAAFTIILRDARAQAASSKVATMNSADTVQLSADFSIEICAHHLRRDNRSYVSRSLSQKRAQ